MSIVNIIYSLSINTVIHLHRRVYCTPKPTVAEKDIAAAVARSAAAIAAAIIARRGRVRKMCVNLELLYYSNKKWAVEEIFGTIKRIQSPHVY